MCMPGRGPHPVLLLHLHLEAGQGGAGGGRRELQAGGQGGKVERGVPPERLGWEDANQGADGGLQATGGFRNQVRELSI